MSGVLTQDRSQSPYDGTATGGTGTPVPIYPGFDFITANTQYIDIGAGYNGIKSVLLWVKPDAVNLVTDTPIDLNGIDYLTIVNGTLTKNGFAGGTTVLYTDAVAAAVTITTNWHMIGITDTVGKNASDLDIGRKDIGYFNGVIGGVLLFAKVLTQTEIQNIYNIMRYKFPLAA